LITTMVVRDMVVFRYRGRVLDAISRCADGDIKARREWRWRFDAFRRVSYDDMMMAPWKPPSWFYPDKAFMRCDEASGSLFPLQQREMQRDELRIHHAAREPVYRPRAEAIRGDA
jgi:hypothetical protein